ncbi:SAM-dependent methyltransferase [Actinophytocola gossypii]|uniref:Methyltransferase domain-containing protein n=1 Tax=Actinophytocola gossypii TaxID=2812003 RepID=A0ABT2JHQ1_9PSEU|nr:methyltransferase domain-containing protein [Actinophytocola gossypii]MCT2586794.1 methyltransferase domain-containing protein [Actinophytocola gossypii]
MTEVVPDAAEIGRHYDKSSPVGDEFRDGQLHMWYYYDRDDEAAPEVATNRITRKVVEALGLRAGEKVLDAGCGPGTPALYVAENFGADVTGITVSNVEVERATRRAEARGTADLTRFQYGDFMALDFPDRAFDAVLAIESLQNAPDLAQVLRELFRVLRPGGRIAFSDFSLEEPDEQGRVAAFMSALRLHTLPTTSEWLGHLRAAGFEIEEYTQCGPRTYGRNGNYTMAAMAKWEEVANKVGETTVTEFSQVHNGFFKPRRNQIGYVIAAARRPYR